MTHTILENLKKKTLKSHCSYYVGCVGFDKNFNFVGSSINQPRLHKEGGGVHAELNLLKKFGPRIKHILLCRLGKSGKFRPIHPCKNCRKVLDKMGIRVIMIEGEKD